MSDDEQNLKSKTTLSIEDVERVVSAIIQHQSHLQKDFLLTLVTDIDKDKTRLLLSLSELKLNLLEEIKKTQNDTKQELLQTIDKIEQSMQRALDKIHEELRETERQQDQRKTACEIKCGQQIESLKAEHKSFAEKTDIAFEQQKPKLAVIVPLLFFFVSPFFAWVFDLHTKTISHAATIQNLEQQHRETTEQCKAIMNKIEHIQDKTATLRDNLASSTKPLKDNNNDR